MTEKREVPEADRLDQLTPIDQSVAVEAFEHCDTASALVNEADWIDQQISVPVDDPEQEAQ